MFSSRKNALYKPGPTRISDHLDPRISRCIIATVVRRDGTNGSDESTLASDALGSEPDILRVLEAREHIRR